MFKCEKIDLCLLFLRIYFRILLQSTISSMVVGDFSDIHSSNPRINSISYLFLSNKYRQELLCPFNSKEVYFYLDVAVLSSLNYQSNTNFFIYKSLKVHY